MGSESAGGSQVTGGSGARDPRVLLWTMAALALAYLALRFGLPQVAAWTGLSVRPVPVPRFAMGIYMICAVVGALAYVSSDDRRWRLFLGPIVRMLVVAPGDGWRIRVAVLGAAPLLIGWLVWQRVVPTLPEEYGALRNLLPAMTDESRREAMVLFQKNCRPCHGAAAAGDGPLARGLRLRPVDFTDGGTIASVVESYPFWRIREGHLALPDIATPWNSAMPLWGEQLQDDQIWRIIEIEYELSGTEPRRPEGSGR
jgi:mono/diheme cytochrome c family protein